MILPGTPLIFNTLVSEFPGLNIPFSIDDAEFALFEDASQQ